VAVSSRLINHLDKIIGLVLACPFSSQWNKFAYTDFVVHNYAMATLAQQLESVQAAIEKIEDGAQDYSLDTQRVLRGKLSTLYERERSLQRRIRAEGGLGRTVAMY
jgi:hypothetical protein